MSIEIEVIKRERVLVKFLRVSAAVRYWEDATVNGEEDTAGTLIPMRNGDCWEPLIDLATGRIVGWPEGVTADVHYKVCDRGFYWLADEAGRNVVKWASDYIPDDLLCRGESGHGDYIILRVAGDGMIDGWLSLNFDPDEWEAA